jgi:hypothetical protein
VSQRVSRVFSLVPRETHAGAARTDKIFNAGDERANMFKSDAI